MDDIEVTEEAAEVEVEAVNPIQFEHDHHAFRLWVYEDGHAQAEIGRMSVDGFVTIEELNPRQAQGVAEIAKEKGLL